MKQTEVVLTHKISLEGELIDAAFAWAEMEGVIGRKPSIHFSEMEQVLTRALTYYVEGMAEAEAETNQL